MKKFVVFVAVVFSIALAQSVLAASGLIKVSDHVYSYADVKEPSPLHSFGANAGVIVTDAGLIVVDTLISAKEAQRFIADIKAISNKPVKYVINTHFHLDHTFGNSEFKKMGAAIIAQERDKAALAQKGEETLKNAAAFGLTPEAMQGTEIALPTLSFRDMMTIDLGGVEVQLMYGGPSHSAGSILVYLPGEKVMFAGDILFTDVHPYMADGEILEWLAALDFIQTLGEITIIPGHGPLSGKKDVVDMKAYLLTFDQKAKELVAQSSDVDKMAADLKTALPTRSRLEWAIGTNIKAKYLPAK